MSDDQFRLLMQAIKEVAQDVTVLQGEMKDLRGEVNDLRGEVKGVRQEMADFREEVERRFDRLEYDIDSIKLRTFDNEEEIKKVRRRIAETA